MPDQIRVRRVEGRALDVRPDRLRDSLGVVGGALEGRRSCDACAIVTDETAERGKSRTASLIFAHAALSQV